MNLPNTGSPWCIEHFPNINGHVHRAHRSRSRLLLLCDQATRHLNPLLQPQGGKAGRAGREGTRLYCAEAQAPAQFPCASIPTSAPHFHPRSLLWTERGSSSSHWVESECRGEATGTSTMTAAFLAIQPGVHISVSCMLKTTRQS